MTELSRSAKKLLTFLKKISRDRGASFKSTIEEFGKCNQEQANLLLDVLAVMVERFGSPTFIKYNGNKRVHATGVEPFSLHCERIRFELEPYFSGVKADICLARSTTPGCRLRDPLLKLRFDSGERRLLIIRSLNQVFDFINGSTEWDGLFDENEVAPATSPRRSVPSTEMSFNERNILLPEVKSYLKNQSYKFVVEDEQLHGRYDLYVRSPEKILVELKYINPDENALGKLRYAIGQVLLYAFDQRGSRDIEKLWVVTNECTVCDAVKEALKEIQAQTSVEFFQLRRNNLLEIDEW